MNGVSRRNHILFAILVTLVTSVPFLNKPIHIDDPVVLHVIHNIIENPLDPLRGEYDWDGHFVPLWKMTTNPPFLSYYLAPFAMYSDFSEIVMHAGMMVFLFLIAGSMVFLAMRFTQGTLFPLLFVMTSCAVMISGNVMRDVPAAGLTTAGIALFIAGTDREKIGYLITGGILCGLAILTKYSAVIGVPILFLYPFFKRKYRLMWWAFLPFSLLVLWCLHNWLYYGAVHIFYLKFERSSDPDVNQGYLPWQDKFCGALVILSSILYLFPVLIRDAWKRKDALILGLSPVIVLIGWWGVQIYYQGQVDGQYLFWSISGAILISICLYEGIRRGLPYLFHWGDEESGDSLFLFAWLCAPVVFSIWMAPFQAVRHLVFALPPLTMLAFRYLERPPVPSFHCQRKWLISLLCVQTIMSFILHCADYEYADTYRDFAEYAKENWTSDQYETWFVGHWGWKFYAEYRQGFRQVHRYKELPKEGDILIWPRLILIGIAMQDRGDFVDRLELLEMKEYPGALPVRTMNFRGACFYAVVTRNLPYRFFQDMHLEDFCVYRVGPETEKTGSSVGE